MHHAKFLCKAEKAFGVTDEQISARVQAVVELVDQALLFRFVEIDHNVAAKNNVVTAWQEFGFEIVKVERDQFFQLRLDTVFVGGFFEIAKTAGVIDRFHLLFGVTPS